MPTTTIGHSCNIIERPSEFETREQGSSSGCESEITLNTPTELLKKND